MTGNLGSQPLRTYLQAALRDIEGHWNIPQSCQGARLRILKFFPSYIFRRNIIGSPSNLVVSKKAVKKFDNNLKWLVDVDWFYSMISKDNWIIAKDINVISIVDENTSITNSISKNLDSITLKETDYLCKKFNDIFIFKLLKPKNLFDYFLGFFERLSWIFIKVYQICYSILSRKSMPNWW